jgi:hypothetical protein
MAWIERGVHPVALAILVSFDSLGIIIFIILCCDFIRFNAMVDSCLPSSNAFHVSVVRVRVVTRCRGSVSSLKEHVARKRQHRTKNAIEAQSASKQRRESSGYLWWQRNRLTKTTLVWLGTVAQLSLVIWPLCDITIFCDRLARAMTIPSGLALE